MKTKAAVVVGAGPNGLAAAITLARAGLHVTVLEASDTVGGGTRTEQLTRPGYRHDVCSAFHPLGVVSPFLLGLPLARYGLRWIVPDVAVAHPLDGGEAAAAHRSITATAAGLGVDGRTWTSDIGGLARRWPRLREPLLGPGLGVPRHPLTLAWFGLRAALPATTYLRSRFRTTAARALFAGMAAHAILPLARPQTAAFGLLLGGLAHVGGWPVAAGGSQAITGAMAAYFEELGGELVTGAAVRSPADVPPADITMYATAPGTVARVYGGALPQRSFRRLTRFRHGPGSFKLDLATTGPIPWEARVCRVAGTVHAGGTWEEVVDAEAAPWEGRIPATPFVLVGQQSVLDPERTPDRGHTVWAYCHVPPGAEADMTEPILGQIERFAPGFRATVTATHALGPADLERYNENYRGGDISGGAHDGLQLLWRGGRHPYHTGIEGVYICSASTPPGAGVHGMCGYHAATVALRHMGR